MLVEQLKSMQAARLAMADKTGYSRAYSFLENQLNILNHGKEKVARQGWDYLRAIKKEGKNV